MRRLVPFVLVAALAFTAGHVLSSPARPRATIDPPACIVVNRPVDDPGQFDPRETILLTLVHSRPDGGDRELWFFGFAEGEFPTHRYRLTPKP